MKQKISRKLQLIIVFLSGFLGILPAAFCRHGQCTSCFGCAGIGIFAISMGVWNKFRKMRMGRRDSSRSLSVPEI